MTARTTSRIWVFRHPFKLTAVDDLLPAGSYVVETDEEQLDTSFLAYHRVATMIRLPGPQGRTGMDRVVAIDPAELDAVHANDALAPAPGKAP